jgi:hypothetical protein
MKIILPCLTALAWAVATTPVTAELPLAAGTTRTQTSGDQLLQQAIAQLERRESIAARLRFQVSLEGRQLAGAGNYWQQGRGDALRIRLELRIAGETNLLEVSNGRFLWTDRSLPTGRTVTRLDLRQLRSDATLADPEFDGIEPGQATWSPIQPELSAQSGGLSALMTALKERFAFSPPQVMRWTPSPPLPGLPDSLPVYAVVGRWKREPLLALLPQLQHDAGAAVEQTAAPPARVPQEVLLLIGQADTFPYHVEYRRFNDPSASNAAADKPTPYQLSADPLVLVEYFDVASNVPIAASQFDYSPGDAKWNDRTAEQLEQLRRERQEQLATRNRDGQR